MKMQFIILMQVFCWLFSACNQSEKRIEQEKVDLRDYMLMNIFQSEGFSFLPYNVVKDMDGKLIRMDSIFKTPKLVFRFSQTNCDMCIEAEMKHLKSLNMEENVICLASYNNIRMVKLAKQQYQVQFPIYFLPLNLNNFVLPRAKEESGMPYFFYVDQHLHAHYLFTPSKQFPEISKRYIAKFKTLKHTNKEVILFDSLHVDFGKIEKGKTYQAKFVYVNRSDKPLVIKNVKTSCGCMVSTWCKKPLAVGESANLIIKFMPDTPGYNSKAIMVFHNLSDSPVHLRVTADVTSENSHQKDNL